MLWRHVAGLVGYGSDDMRMRLVRRVERAHAHESSSDSSEAAEVAGELRAARKRAKVSCHCGPFLHALLAAL